MRRNNSLWKTTAVSISAMMTVSMGAAVWAASTEKTTQESQSDQAIENETEKITEDSETKEDSNNTENQTAEPQSTNTEDASDSSENQTEECKIELSDDSILVDGEAISTDSESAVYAGADIVYYKEGQDSTYGAGGEDDGHSEEEAAEHTVVTITKAGTYRVSGTLSKGQIAIDLGEDSRDDESAVVNLILDNADITCTVASGIVVYNAYECGSDDTEAATKDVDTTNAGVHIILADDSENTVNGSHVAKIYKEGTTQEDVDAGNAKKQWKFDAAIDSLVSIEFDAEEETGTLAVNSDNEGIETSRHLTINGGTITINSNDDAINANEDGVSVITINGGVLTCNAGGGKEGDGIDSNGWIVINDGVVVSAANATSQDSGVDSDNGIYINGGTVLASGNMYDEVSEDSEQAFVALSFADSVEAGQMFALKNADGEIVTVFSAANDFQTLVYSSSELTDGDYTLYEISSAEGVAVSGLYTEVTSVSDEVQLQGSKGAGGFGRMGGGMGKPNGERPEMPDGEAPSKSDGEAPSGQEGEAPSKPEGEAPSGQNGERPERPEDSSEEASSVFTISGISNNFSHISELTTEAYEEESSTNV